MKENSRSISILITLLISLLVIISFRFLRINTSADKNIIYEQQDKSVEIYHPQIMEQTPPSTITTPSNYTLQLENGVLNFYVNFEKNKVLLESAQINTTLFPKNDIDALSGSITVSTLEEGISIIEDFTS